MLLLILPIVTTIGIIVWAILAIPKDLPATDSSVNAIDNAYHWLGSKLGPNWPLVLSIIVILLTIILGLFITNFSPISVDESVANTIVKFIALLTMGVAALLTMKWRSEYIRDPGFEYYVELAIIVLLLGVNGYLLARS